MTSSPWKPFKFFAKRFEERKRLITPFVKRFGGPAIIHANPDTKTFEKILREGKLRIPSDQGSPVKCPYLSKDLGIDNVVYFSLGFVYATAYGYRYNFLFDTTFLKELTYYKGGVSYICYRNVVRYLYAHDKPYLEKLARHSPECKAVLDKFYHEPYKGKVLRQLDFWRIEEPLYHAIMKHPHKKKLVRIIKETAKGLSSTYPYSRTHAMKNYLTDATPEILSQHTIDLHKNPHFIGVYIHGKLPKSSLRLLQKHYPDKLLFDGKRFRKIAMVK